MDHEGCRTGGLSRSPGGLRPVTLLTVVRASGGSGRRVKILCVGTSGEGAHFGCVLLGHARAFMKLVYELFLPIYARR